MECEVCRSAKTFSRCYTCNPNGGYSMCQICDSQTHPDATQIQGNPHRRGMLCSECEEEDAFGYCADCEQYMCQTCSKSIHNKGARLRHVLDQERLFQDGFVNNNIQPHVSHQQEHMMISNKSQQQQQQQPEKNIPRNQGPQVINSIQIQVVTPRRIIEATQPQKLPLIPQEVQHEDSKEDQRFPPDSSQQQLLLQTQPKKNKLVNPGKNTHDYPICQLQSQISVPIFQPLLVDLTDPYLTSLMILLREQASEGNLMINYHQIVWLIESELRMNKLEAKQLLLKAEQRGYIIVTVRSFGCVKNLTLISMRLQFVTLEGVQWVLKGLKRDGMCPNERAIQSRIKEAFGVKVSSHLWEVILEGLDQIDGPKYLSQEALEEARAQLLNLKIQKDQKYDYQYEMEHSHIDQREIRYNVKGIEKVEENETQQKVIHLYLSGELYLGQDQSFNGPVLRPDNDEQSNQREIMLDQIVYSEFKKFLYEYFIGTAYDNIDADQRDSEERDEFLQTLKANSITQKSGKLGSNKKPQGVSKHGAVTANQHSSNNMSGSSDSNTIQGHTMSPPAVEFNEDGKAIPGGRYGCAQFVKLCAPQLLKEQSLGKLAQMVQRSINEDYLRYQRTLLILTQCIDKTKSSSPINSSSFSSEEEQLKQLQKKAEIGAKLQAVKCSILEVLAEHKEGVSLPQLPIYLKRKLPFKLDWNQLGFAKLKDLIMSMNDQIKLELIGPNHTLAYLIYSKRYHHTNGAYSDDLQNIPRMKNLISEKQKFSVDFHNKDFKNNLLIEDCKTLEQILALFYQMLKEFPMGIDSFKIVPWISEKLGHPFDIKAYGCQSIYEFIRKFIMPTTEIFIINNKPDHFLIRSSQIYSHVQQPPSSAAGSGSYQQRQSDSERQSLGHSSSQSSFSTNKTPQNYNQKNPQNPRTQETPRSSQGTSGSKGNKRKGNPTKNSGEPHQNDESQDIIASGIYHGQNGKIEDLSTENKAGDITNQTGFPYDASLMSRRMPSGVSTFHMPCASSFYGHQNEGDGQSQIQINISHLRTNTEGEMNSSNATQIHQHQGHQVSGFSGQGNQILLPQHYYNGSNEFNPAQGDWQAMNRPMQNQNYAPQQFKNDVPYQDSMARSGFNPKKQKAPGLPPLYQQKESSGSGGNLNQGNPYDQGGQNHQQTAHHQQMNSYGSSIEGGFLSFASKNNPNNPAMNQLNPFQLFENNIDSQSNSPRHNRAVSYLYNHSMMSSQDFSNYTISQPHHQHFFSSGGQSLFMQSTGGGAGGYNHNPGMPVHKEASKESSLEGGNEVAEKDDKGKEEEALNPNSSIVDGAEDDIQSPLHSRFIEDLLGDADNTDADMLSQANSLKTTVVHTPQLSMSSFYKQLPPSQGSSYYPAHQGTNQMHAGMPAYQLTGVNRNHASTFDQSAESDETNVHLMMNNLQIKVGHNTNNTPGSQLKMTQHAVTKPQMPNQSIQAFSPLQADPYKQQQQAFFPQNMVLTNTNTITTDQDNAQFMHSKAMSEDFSSQSLFGNHFVFNNYVTEQQPQTQRPSMPAQQVMNFWPQQQQSQQLRDPYNQTNSLTNARIAIELKQPTMQPHMSHLMASANSIRPAHLDAPSFHPSSYPTHGQQQHQQQPVQRFPMQSQIQLSSGIHPLPIHHPILQTTKQTPQSSFQHHGPLPNRQQTHTQLQQNAMHKKPQQQAPTPTNNSAGQRQGGKVFQNSKKQQQF